MQLRDYQFDGVGRIRQEFRQGSKRPLYQLSTGGGKTIIAAYIIESAVAKGGRSIFLAARRELIHQASNRLTTPHGVIMSGSPPLNPSAPVQVASIQSLLTRELPWEPTLIFLDECSHSTAASHQKLLSRFPDVPVVGLTATPVRDTGLGLGDYFTSMVCGPSITALIDQKFLVPVLHYAATPGALLGDPVATWLRYANQSPTIAFASSVEESIKLVAKFNAAGVPAAHVDGTSEDEYRDALPAKLASGEIKVVSNYQVWTEGTDIPAVSCVILDRITSSLAVYLQAIGRGLRPYPGKTRCIVLDHGGNVHVHGRADCDREWVLTSGRDVIKGTPDVDDKIQVCPTCYTVAPPMATHCACGYKFFRKPKKTYKHKAGTLELHHANGVVSTIPNDKLRSAYERMLWLQKTGRKKDGTPFSPRYAFYRFMQEYGQPPNRTWG